MGENEVKNLSVAPKTISETKRRNDVWNLSHGTKRKAFS
jgi:hypothetical protein